jgi:hypothetical protein
MTTMIIGSGGYFFFVLSLSLSVTFGSAQFPSEAVSSAYFSTWCAFHPAVRR